MPLPDRALNDVESLDAPLLALDDLAVTFEVRGRPLRAVDGVSLALHRGETVGLVGESGSGKSTLAKAMLRLVPTSRGTIRFEGRDITQLGPRALRPLRRRMQMVFQDPFGSLNPRATVGATLTEALAFHRVVPRDERRARAAELLELVGLSDRLFDRLPHELSGGQRQRVGIARALSVEPTLVVQDEPVSALDVSVRAQLLVLLGALRTELALTYLFISHDLSVVESFCDRVLVMYLGRVVEALPVEDLAARARHPYTKALLAAVPSMDPRARRRTPRAALDSPSPLDVPSGCAYRTRCELAEPSCSEQRPTLVRIAEAHHVACPVVR